ncbi:TetR/AcrR family transcriptional regulator [Epilithonimonas lactis]|uniref:TetR family transcriptional regulator n=1 Tax=Epilithonimonas lactis TaxID=421072 RepID=A0A085BGC8_9FLAO|nr:TetR/AcrR family transcriptional regulator [Epilithonimonas lactis]KFC21523.1 TetR family transcriptional regulator [Epilithonimonas lactis]SEP87859.1 transcriptional regulator, TetR family [Epilithonimonas lactis]
MTTLTKDRIIEAAISVFNQDHSAPLQKVADRAGITRRTLHRYFKDREELVAICELEMEISCKKAMISAIKSSDDAFTRLKNILFAGVDCGAKYSFFYKLHQEEGYYHNANDKDCSDYDYIFQSFRSTIQQLQDKNVVNKSMTVKWIQHLHAGIINSSVNASSSGELDQKTIKDLAWQSFIKGISS